MIDDATKDHHLESHHELTEAIQRNQAIPSNSFCNVLVAVVRLELVTIRQYIADLEGKLSKVRVCIDPRQLNKQLQADRFPLPLIKDIFSFFANSKIFSTIDLEQAYLQLPILPQHQPKIAFTWGNRHLMFVGTPFGICITASVLQRTMSFLFRGSECTTLFKMTFQSVLSHLNNI
ncbi:hypothetical protein BASA83_006542 [Batrachochytrium salamandrivorans]|nr:hypothetical protein BASA83_006542 [Batrachochytrium salamandrivorans]